MITRGIWRAAVPICEDFAFALNCGSIRASRKGG
jgi:hypothetical protein